MTADDISRKASRLSQLLDELQAKCVSNPANAPEILSDAFESLQASLEDLSASDEELIQRNGELLSTQSALQKSEEMFRVAQELSPDGFTILRPVRDASGQIIDFTWVYENDTIARLNGTDPKAVIGQRLLKLFPGHRGTQFLKAYRQVAETGERCIFEDEYGGESLPKTTWFRIVVVPTSGEDIAVLAEDITERKKAEERLLESEQKFRNAVDHFPNVFVIYNADRSIRYVNSKGLEVLGLSEQDVIGRKDDEIFPPHMINSYLPALKRAVETKTPQTLERTRHASLGGQTIIINIIPLLNDKGEVRQILAMSHDISERKHAEEALRESEEWFRVLIKAASQAVWETNAEGVVVTDSPSWRAYTGQTFEEWLGYGWVDAIHPDDCEYAERQWRESVAAGRNVNAEFRLKSPDGKWKWTNVLAAPIRGTDGRIIKWVGMNLDINERKQMEELAKIEEKRLQSIIKISQHNPKSVQELLDYALDEAIDLSESKLGYILYYNEEKRECTLHAWSKEAMKECSIAHRPTVFQLDNAGIWGEAVRQRRPIVINDFLAPNPLKKGYPEGHAHVSRFMTIPVFIDDRIVAVVAVANKTTDYSDQDVHQLTMLMDSVWAIAERKHAEEALRESEARFRSVLENSLDAAYRRNLLIDRYDYMSPVIEQITGYSAQEMDEMNIDEVLERIHPDDRSQVEAELEHGINAGWGIIEYRFKGKNGQYRCLADHFTVIKDKEGRPIFRGGIVRDITDRKKVEEELRKAHNELELRVAERTSELVKANEDLLRAKEEAEAAVEAKAAFLANMSHELRTPLNAVIGFSSLLLDDDLTADQKENIESIKKGGEALLAIIGEILEFSRAEKEKITLEHQPFSLKRCIEESLDIVAVQAEEKGLNLSYTISYGAPDTIIGDPGRLRQVLINLLNNAVKFTDKGDVSLSISSMALDSNKHQITFEAKDTGIGMPQDKMDRLFKPFSQLEYVMSRKRDGAGLGLAISKKLVELMGGKIWAESEEGKGSTFRFTIQAETLPGEQLDSGEKDRAEYKNLSKEKPLSILVAEDNPSNQKVLVEMLKRLGYRPDAVADGSEVIQALVIRHYDLIFMDVRMPEIDGLTATKEIRKLWPDNGPTIVAITAFAMEGDQEMCLEAGMDGYIAKPVKLGDLAAVISTYESHRNS